MQQDLLDGQPLSRPSRVIEVIRRLALVGGLIAGAWLAFRPAEYVLRVEVADFAKQLKSQAKRDREWQQRLERSTGRPAPFLNPDTTRPASDFAAKELEGREVIPDGADWSRFAANVIRTLKGEATDMGAMVAQRYGSYCLYLPADYPPLAELKDRLEKKPLLYVAFNIGGAEPQGPEAAPRPRRHLLVQKQYPGDAKEAQAAVLYPYRTAGGWLMTAALAAYFLLPWYRPGPRELTYSRAGAVVVPDLLGAGLAIALFVLLLRVTVENSSGRPYRLLDWEHGWAWLTLTVGLLAGLFLVINLFSLSYACRSVHVLPWGLRVFGLFGGWACRYDQIAHAEPASYDVPRWLKGLMLLLSIGNRRLAGPVLTAQTGHGIAITDSDGRRRRLLLSHLAHSDLVVREMLAAGVKMDPRLLDPLDRAAPAPLPGDEVGPARLVLPAWALVLLVLLGGAVTAVFQAPGRPVKVVHEMRFSDEALAQRMKLTDQMKQISIRMSQAMEQARKGSGTERAEAMRTFEQLQERYQELDRQYESIQPDEEP